MLELLETAVLQRVSTIPYPIHRINWLVYWNQTQVSTKLPMRASGCSWAPKKNPYEMDSEKGNVKIGRKIGCPQIIEKTGSSGWTRIRLRETLRRDRPATLG